MTVEILKNSQRMTTDLEIDTIYFVIRWFTAKGISDFYIKRPLVEHALHYIAYDKNRAWILNNNLSLFSCSAYTPACISKTTLDSVRWKISEWQS